MKNLSLSFAFFLFIIQNLFAQTFWSQNFAGGFPSAWTSEDLSGQGIDWNFATDAKLISDIEKFNSSLLFHDFVFLHR